MQSAHTEDAVEAFEEGHAVDEVQAFARRGADGVDDQVNAVRVAANGSVESTLSRTCMSNAASLSQGRGGEAYWEGLGVGCERERRAADAEDQVGQLRELGSRQADETRVPVEGAARRALVLGEGIYRLLDVSMCGALAFVNAASPVERRIRVVPVSTIPAVVR